AVRRRFVEPDRKKADALFAANQRNEQRGPGSEASGKIGREPAGVAHEHRNAGIERLGDERALSRRGKKRLARQRFEAEAGRGRARLPVSRQPARGFPVVGQLTGKRLTRWRLDRVAL